LKNVDSQEPSKKIDNNWQRIETTTAVAQPPSLENDESDQIGVNESTSNGGSIKAHSIVINKKAAIGINFDDDVSSEGIFSSPGTIFDKPWSSCYANSADLSILLPAFSLYSSEQPGVQTLVLQLNVPSNSNAWALNICPATDSPDDDLHLSDVLFHFNPRYIGKFRGVVMNDRQGTWGAELRRPLGDSR